MCRDRQGLAVGADEHAMAGAFLPPVDAVLPRYRLKLLDTPIQRDCGASLRTIWWRCSWVR